MPERDSTERKSSRPPPPPLISLEVAALKRAEVQLVYATHEHVLATMRHAYQVLAGSGCVDERWLSAQQSMIASYELHAVRNVQHMLRRKS